MIPGSHNSGAIKPFKGYFASHIYNRYTVNQEESVANQLVMGIRFFDVRAMAVKNKDVINIHGGGEGDLENDLGRSEVVSSTTVVVQNPMVKGQSEMTSNDSGVTSDASEENGSSQSLSPVTPEVKVKSQGQLPQVHVVLQEEVMVKNDGGHSTSESEDGGENVVPGRKVDERTGKRDADANSLSSVPQTSDGEAF